MANQIQPVITSEPEKVPFHFPFGPRENVGKQIKLPGFFSISILSPQPPSKKMEEMNKPIRKFQSAPVWLPGKCRTETKTASLKKKIVNPIHISVPTASQGISQSISDWFQEYAGKRKKKKKHSLLFPIPNYIPKTTHTYQSNEQN